MISSPANRWGMAVSARFKKAETGKPLIEMMKLSAVSPFHDFGGHRSRNFNRDRPTIENSQWPPPENGETAKQTAIYPEISKPCLFQPA